MSIRLFLDAAYALLVDAWMSVGTNMLEAVQKVNESLGMAPLVAEGTAPPSTDQALRELNKSMAGVRKR